MLHLYIIMQKYNNKKNTCIPVVYMHVRFIVVIDKRCFIRKLLICSYLNENILHILYVIAGETQEIQRKLPNKRYETEKRTKYTTSFQKRVVKTKIPLKYISFVCKSCFYAYLNYSYMYSVWYFLDYESHGTFINFVLNIISCIYQAYIRTMVIIFYFFQSISEIDMRLFSLKAN